MKPFWKSKTIWVNGLVLGVSVTGFLSTNDIVQQNPTAVAFLVVAQSLANLVLRYVTDKPIK